MAKSNLAELVRWKIRQKTMINEIVASKADDNTMSPVLTAMLLEMVQKRGKNPRYAGYTYNEDMQAYATMMLCKSWHHFKPERSDNPYAYYHCCIHSAFCQYLNKERNARDVKEAYAVEIESMDDSYLMVDDEQHF